MSAHARFIGILMAIVLLVAVVAAQGPVTYIVTIDDQGNSYYLENPGDGTLLGPQTSIPQAQSLTSYGYGVGIGQFTDDVYYDFAVGTGSDPFGQPKEIVLLKRTNDGVDFQKSTVAEWSSGSFPGDLAVANFNGKAYEVPDDFAMVRVGSPDLGMYVKTGVDTFTSSEIEDAVPLSCVGADAADVDHDGNADLMVAQKERASEYEPFYIYIFLGNGDGTFQSPPYKITSNVPYAGITAADFNGDLKVDLIATIALNPYGANGFDFYQGNGDGTFGSYGRFGGGWLSFDSPIDNFDLDNDGDQDIIASNLLFNGEDHGTSVIVGLNDGAGNFDFVNPQVIPGTEGSYRISLAAPPVFQNEAPVAVVSFKVDPPGILYESNKIVAGTNLTFSNRSADSSEVSYDPEDKPLEFSWSFGDGSDPVTTQGEDVSHKFTTPTPLTQPDIVTLTITDNYGVMATQSVTIKVNNRPVAVDDTYSTSFNTPLTVLADQGVLINDEDADEDSLAVIPESVTAPTAGRVEMNKDGSFTYVPSDGFTGIDFFEYKVNDGLEDSDNSATVTIAVNSPSFEAWDVSIVPNMINLKSRGVFIAFVTLKKPYSANDVQAGSVYCQGPGQAVDQKAVAIRLIRHAKFPQAFGAIFRTADLNGVQVGSQKLMVNGTVMYEGLSYAFSGYDTVRVFTLKTKVRDETDGWEQHGDKKLFDDNYKGNKGNRDNNNKKDNR